MRFRSEQHKRFFEAARFKYEDDRERLALFYLLGLDDDARAHWRECYAEGGIRLECFEAAWQTSGSRRAIALAFALYGGAKVSIVGVMSDEEYFDYFLIAIGIRFGRDVADPRPHRKKAAGRPVLYTEAAAAEVKRRHAAGVAIRKIAAEMSMSPTTVVKLLHR